MISVPGSSIVYCIPNFFVFRRSLPLSELTLEPKEGMILAFVPDFSKTAKVEEEVNEVVKEGEGPAQE